jgi:hypothetical protein
VPTSRNVQVTFAVISDGFTTLCCQTHVRLDGLYRESPRRRALHSAYRSKTRRRNRRR